MVQDRAISAEVLTQKFYFVLYGVCLAVEGIVNPGFDLLLVMFHCVLCRINKLTPCTAQD